MDYCAQCGTQLPEGARFCPGCGKAVAVDEPDAERRVVHGPAGPIPVGRDSSIVGWVLIGAVVGLLGGLIAVHLTDQAMCPHAILGPCSTLTSRGRGEIVILGVVVGAIAARLLVGALHRRRG